MLVRVVELIQFVVFTISRELQLFFCLNISNLMTLIETFIIFIKKQIEAEEI